MYICIHQLRCVYTYVYIYIYIYIERERDRERERERSIDKHIDRFGRPASQYHIVCFRGVAVVLLSDDCVHMVI